MICEVVKLIGVSFAEIVSITFIVLGYHKVHSCYISYILLQDFYYFFNFLLQLVIPNIAA